MSTPMISVIMPAYNAEKFVKEACESILAQTYRDFEFLVINDGSVDGTIEIVESLRDPRIRVIHNPRNLGIAASLNEGLRQSKGRYIARMDADDICLPQRFERQIEFMEANPDISICGAWAELFGDEQGYRRPQCDSEYIKVCSLLTMELVHPTVLFRSEDIKAHNLWYDPDFIHEDFELFSRAAQVVKLANIPEVLLRYRVAKSSATWYNSEGMIRDAIKISMRNLKRLNVDVPPSQQPFLHILKSELNTLEDIQEVKALFTRIMAANKLVGKYNSGILGYLLNRHYYSLFTPYYRSAPSYDIIGAITYNACEASKSADICLFGMGKAARDLAPYFVERLGSRIKCVSDNDPQKWGNTFFGLECVSPEELLKNNEQTAVVVLAGYDNIMDIIDGLIGKGFTTVIPFIEPIV